jgi:zinc transport system substrate-binding protein
VHGAAVILTLTVLLAAVCTLSSCGPSKSHKDGNVIAVSIEPLRFFTEQICGDRFKVVSIVPKGFSPEGYEPSPQQLIEVSDAKAFLKVGQLGFETTWLDKLEQNEPTLPVFSTSDSLETAASGMRRSTFDPHTWTSPRTAEVICRNICRTLCTIDSAGAPLYRARLQKLLLRIRNVDSRIHKILENIPSRSFVIVHPALSYFASEYGLTQLPMEQEGKEAGPLALQELVRQSRSEGVRVVLVQQEFSEQAAQTLAREIGAKVVTINPLDYHWDQQMIHIANAIKNGK